MTTSHRYLRAMAVLSIAALGTGSMATPASPMTVSSPRELSLRQSDLVQGALSSEAGQGASLDLLDASGRHLRRLVAADSTQRSFIFLAPQDGHYRLQITPGADGEAPALELQPVLPATRQVAVPVHLFSPRLQALAEKLQALPNDSVQRTAATTGLLDDFWSQVQASGTPLIEPMASQPRKMLATFLWRGTPRNVQVMASPSGDHDAMQHLPGTDIWYSSYPVPDSARLSYRIAPDVPTLSAAAAQQRHAILATAQRDPLNSHWSTPDGHSPLDIWDGNSVLELPNAPPQPWIKRRPGVTRGTLEKHRITSTVLHNTRDVYLYRPAGWKADPQRVASHQNLLLAFDGEKYNSLIPTPDILANLLADGLLAPTAAILVANADAASRSRELPPNPAFARFIAEELMPWAAQQGVAAPASRTALAGSSYGGLAAAYIALQSPQWFGNVLSQSGSFWWPGPAMATGATEPGWLSREYAARPRLSLRFYLEAGLFEGTGVRAIPPATRHLRDVLIAKGYAITHAEYASGHDNLHWRGSLACGLVNLIGTPEQAMPETTREVWQQACPGRP